MCLIFLIKPQSQKTVVFAAKYQLKRITVAILNCASFHMFMLPYLRLVYCPVDDTLFEVGPEIRSSGVSSRYCCYDKKLCCRKEAARCFVSVQLQYKTSTAVFYYQLFRLQIYHCVQLNSFLFSSLRRIRPCCRPSQTNIRWCVATVRSTLHGRR